MTNDVSDDGGLIKVSMLQLANGNQEGLASLKRLIDAYYRWIDLTESRVPALEARHRAAAEKNVKACRIAAKRMEEGLASLKDPLIGEAFRLANRAMLIQQMRLAKREPRKLTWSESTSKLEFKEAAEPLDLSAVPEGKGEWRAFQIAFLLMSIPSTADRGHEDRELVDLIWFPTGGGKTEAYLGLAAFSILLRRLRAIRGKPRREDEDAGTQVLMRYTLRLLTAQQFQRATGLLCAMEYLRRCDEPALGKLPFTIGMWVGGTPNRREQARAALNALREGKKAEHDIVVLDKCPWCRAQLGVIEKDKAKSKFSKFTKGKGKGKGGSRIVVGYTEKSVGGGETVICRCSDPACVFNDQLPIQFTDEDLYHPGVPPASLIIGTVDKFAMLAWEPRARRFFGRDAAGAQLASPPQLIIQDELHLISGPLGSIMGLYELLIDHLCTLNKPLTRPKIVTSTATIRGYREQIRGVFGRADAALFPPAGTEAGDSFFASYAKLPTGELRRGRLYVGVNAPGLGSLQTAQVRTFTALLQATSKWDAKARDPWWTLLAFFNSLRELGGSLTLFFSDIPERLEQVRIRLGADRNTFRTADEVRELTGRLDSASVRESLSELEVTTESRSPRPVDACLASNIIEVGVDVDRLSLLAVVGQPKTTAQYIQVTGRVGRRWWERPGLIVTLYSATKPRDRSHFEKFRTYHERLYAQVEPTSVTPFSRPAAIRALHAVMVAYARQTLPEKTLPHQVTDAALAPILDLIRERAALVDSSELPSVLEIASKRVNEWMKWGYQEWGGFRYGTQDGVLMRPAGRYAPPDQAFVTWETPSSMRNVDAECDLEITLKYLLLAAAPSPGGFADA
jgi:hypothetical protein